MLKKMIWLLAALVSGVGIGFGALVTHNNYPVDRPSQAEINASWENSIRWLEQNRAAALANENTILWWMIQESGKISGDHRLKALADEFTTRYNAKYDGSAWSAFFAPERFWGANFPRSTFEEVGDYQLFFLFGLSCGKQFMEEPIIQAQTEVDFCRRTHPLGPACVTHQMMGFRFLQRTQCDRVPGLDEKVAALQSSIEAQLTWDPRVVDVYIQRVLMLVDSGAEERVKPRWLQRVLAAQLPDGSWSNLQPLVPLGGRFLGFNEKLVGVGPLRGNLHATAQGIWLMSMLRANQAAAASKNLDNAVAVD